MNKRVVFGLPLNPAPLLEQLRGRSFCVSYSHKRRLGAQLHQAIELVGEDGILLVDNGAFTAWRAGKKLDWCHWDGFAAWAKDILDICPQAVMVVPDVIGGTVEENWQLAMEFCCSGGIPWDRCMTVWHMHESLDYLRHMTEMQYIAIGSSGQYAKVGTAAWHKRMRQAFRALDRATTRNGLLRPWVHLMRAQQWMHAYPVDSCDSCNIAVNHNVWARRNPGPNRIGRMAEPILSRVAGSCTGIERRWIDPPAVAASVSDTLRETVRHANGCVEVLTAEAAAGSSPQHGDAGRMPCGVCLA